MTSSSVNLAYFTVIEDELTGWTGGLLLLNSGGRPLEFQCTLPLRPSRAHEILFGASLRDHLIGEVIGPLLVRKVRTPISMLCCDQPEAMLLDAASVFPIALVVEAAEDDEGPIHDDTLIGSGEVTLVDSKLRVPMEQVDAARTVAEAMSNLPDAVEPFERIREAIREAQSQIARAKSMQREASPHDDSSKAA